MEALITTLPGDDRNRLRVENNVPGGQNRAVAIVGYCGPGAVSEFDSFLYSGQLCCHRVL